MLPGETLLFRLVICVVLAADTAARFEGQDYLENRDHGNQVVGKPIDNRREEQLNGYFFFQQSVEKHERTPEPTPSGMWESQSMAPTNALVKFRPRDPWSAQSVVVHCGEKEVAIEVKRNFLGSGQSVTPSDLKLGGCAAVDDGGETVLFRSELPDCGSTTMMTEDSLIYTFTLVYVPTAIGTTSIIKTNAAQVKIQCHYPRKQLVSSDGVRPDWKQHASIMLAEQTLRFSLRLMTEDWRQERPSSSFRLAEVMYVEASVQRGLHVPLRLYVDRCVASLEPSVDAQPSYAFITNHGCLTDAKVSGGRSFFKDRSHEDKLQFQMQTSRFPQDPRAKMFITCSLKAVILPMATDAEHKACSYLPEAKRWVASGGDNQVCSCCEATCSTQRRSRRSSPSSDEEPAWAWAGESTLGPILVQGTAPERLVGLPDLSGEFSSSLVPQGLEPTLEEPAVSTLVLCGLALLQVVVVTAVIVYRRTQKSN
ncbi:zona pellucida sperm-binding protein 3-like [Gadus chalcogrammus]|uniref:zona pellucida sperm-binding protein 3-like n=1 Tax=Gadus chalcogrammus TaxID=1042646 RepID=UPI0024C2FDD7|nr:zona pellucida sperm-binding protein 3-like [Gadus chalcogrammus]